MGTGAIQGGGRGRNGGAGWGPSCHTDAQPTSSLACCIAGDSPPHLVCSAREQHVRWRLGCSQWARAVCSLGRVQWPQRNLQLRIIALVSGGSGSGWGSVFWPLQLLIMIVCASSATQQQHPATGQHTGTLPRRDRAYRRTTNGCRQPCRVGSCRQARDCPAVRCAV